MKLLLLFFPPLCLLLPRPLPLWMCKGLGLVQGCVVETVIGTVPVLSHMPCLSPRQPEAPAGQGILGAQGPAGGRGGQARKPPTSVGALRRHPCARWAEASVIVCACVCVPASLSGTVRLRGQGQAGLQREGPCCGSRTLPLLGPACPCGVCRSA